MEKIIVGFSKPSSFKVFAWIIMTAYKTPYDHVYLKFHSDSLNRDIIYQASKLMVNFMGTSIFLKDNIVVDEFEVKISTDKKIQLMQFMIDNASKPYGIMNAIGLGLMRICKFIGITINNPFGDGSKTWICDEIVGSILEEFAGAKLPETLDNLNPLDLYNYLKSTKANLP